MAAAGAVNAEVGECSGSVLGRSFLNTKLEVWSILRTIVCFRLVILLHEVLEMRETREEEVRVRKRNLYECREPCLWDESDVSKEYVADVFWVLSVLQMLFCFNILNWSYVPESFNPSSVACRLALPRTGFLDSPDVLQVLILQQHCLENNPSTRPSLL